MKPAAQQSSLEDASSQSSADSIQYSNGGFPRVLVGSAGSSKAERWGFPVVHRQDSDGRGVSLPPDPTTQPITGAFPSQVGEMEQRHVFSAPATPRPQEAPSEVDVQQGAAFWDLSRPSSGPPVRPMIDPQGQGILGLAAPAGNSAMSIPQLQPGSGNSVKGRPGLLPERSDGHGAPAFVMGPPPPRPTGSSVMDRFLPKETPRPRKAPLCQETPEGASRGYQYSRQVIAGAPVVLAMVTAL